LVNINVGSSLITIGADGTIVCSFDLKKSRKCWRISELVIMPMLYFKIDFCLLSHYICYDAAKISTGNKLQLQVLIKKICIQRLLQHEKNKILL